MSAATTTTNRELDLITDDSSGEPLSSGDDTQSCFSDGDDEYTDSTDVFESFDSLSSEAHHAIARSKSTSEDGGLAIHRRTRSRRFHSFRDAMSSLAQIARKNQQRMQSSDSAPSTNNTNTTITLTASTPPDAFISPSSGSVSPKRASRTRTLTKSYYGDRDDIKPDIALSYLETTQK
jgi:hypothetical protein